MATSSTSGAAATDTTNAAANAGPAAAVAGAVQPPRTEFVVLVALLTALVALAIDAMLPAMGAMASELGAGTGNQRQWILTTLFAGLAAGQLLFGPLSDSIGRKAGIGIGLVVFGAGTVACMLATDFPTLLAGRLVQGFGAAGPRVIAMAMVRDQQSGPGMARVMSLVMTVFIAVPIVAPSLGQLVLLWGSWRMIFGGLLAIAAATGLWLALRQPETLPPAQRTPIRARALWESTRHVLSHPLAARYTAMTGVLMGVMVSYLGASEQIFGELYGQPQRFGLYFAVLASAIGMASLLNARLVMRMGMRRLAQRALRGYIALSLLFLGVCLATGGQPPLWAFMAYMFPTFFCLGFLFGNANALAMELLGHHIGLASSVIGTVTTLMSMAIGAVIGHFYDGTLLPLVLGYNAVGVAAWFLMVAAERQRSAAPEPNA